MRPGFRNNPLYQKYLKFVRPVEGEMGAGLAPGPLSFQTVILARKRPARRKLSLTVGMISMNEEAGAVGGSSTRSRAAPNAEMLLVDSSKDETPEIAEGEGGAG